MIRKVRANEIISTYLDVGRKLELYVGPLFFAPFIYAVRTEDGRLVKMGIGLFLLSLFIKLLGGLPALLFIIAILVGLVFESGETEIAMVLWLTASAYLLFRSARSIWSYASIK